LDGELPGYHTLLFKGGGRDILVPRPFFSPAQRLAAQALSNYGRSIMSFGNSLLVALFLMLVVFVALFSLFLFVTLFSLIVQTMEFSAKRKKAAQH